MAAGILPKPGTKLGPCKTKTSGVVRGCAHRDCLTTRRMAEEVCRFCREMIGYDRRFFTDPQNTRDVRGDSELSGPSLVHAECLEDYYDKEPERNGDVCANCGSVNLGAFACSDCGTSTLLTTSKARR